MQEVKRRSSMAGFSLIELMVAMGIIGLLAATFLPVITNSFIGIHVAGVNNQRVYQLQEQVETSLLSEPTTRNYSMTIQFPSTTISLMGEKQEFSSSSSSLPLQITIFKPLK
ncbi:MAG: type II secretion system protein [Methanomassiliicoccales archaeon]